MMINPNELRIGNLIFDDDGALCKIIGFQPYGHSVRCDESEGCDILIDIYAADGKIRKGFSVESTLVNPIPLTPEWLEKCGFEILVGNYDFDTYSKNAIELWEHDEGFCHSYAYGGDIDFLHGLQNLYFCLKGVELEIKL